MACFVSVALWILTRLKLSFFVTLKCFGIIFLSCFIIMGPAWAQDDEDDDDQGATRLDLTNIYDFKRLSGMDARLAPYGNDLMGDMIDKNTGSINFLHTDVSLPGNSDLEVALRRKRKQGSPRYTPFQHGFGDWVLDLPIAHMSYGSRSANGIESPPIFNGGCLVNYGYLNGIVTASNGHTSVHLETGNHASGTILYVPGKGLSGYAGSFEVLADPSSDWTSGQRTTDHAGRCATVTIAPDGTKYKFGRHTFREKENLDIPAEYHATYTGWTSALLTVPRRYAVYLITEVEDVNGNWVRYDYSNNDRAELTRIYSNDGREITVNYHGSIPGTSRNSRRITNVTANERRWEYVYTQSAALHQVYLPDGRYWRLGGSDHGMHSMNVGPHLYYKCIPWERTFDMKHPDGAIGSFRLRENRHIKGAITTGDRHQAHYMTSYTIADAVDDSECGGTRLPNRSQFSETNWERPNGWPVYQAISVASKTISGAGVPEATWNFEYRNYEGGVLDNNWTKVTGPDETVSTYTYQAIGKNHGQLMSIDVKSASGAGEKITYEYNQISEGGAPGGEYGRCHAKVLESEEYAGVCQVYKKRPITKMTHQRGSDTYTTEYEYDFGGTAETFSSRPASVKKYSNISGSTTPRITHTAYEDNIEEWILDLPKTVTRGDGVQMASYEYDNKGLLTSQMKYGIPYYKDIQYHADGNVKVIIDANDRQTEAHNWKRGIPQLVKRAAGSPDAIQYSRVVDDNGWVTRMTDARGNSTSYQHDNMGRMTQITPPSGWDKTDIEYDFSDEGAVQTITQGQSRETITYDGMYRTRLEQTEDISTGWSSYVNTEYDTLGRKVFGSQPSSSESETKGTDYSYDGLGRILSQRENFAPYAETTHKYYSLGRVYKTVPSGLTTQYWPYGYNGPDSTDYRLIRQYDGNTHVQTTSLIKDEWGQMSQLQQYGSLGGVSANKSQNFYYDAQQRLCRHYVPEHGATLYDYDAAGQIIAYAKGQANSGCTAPNNNNRVNLSYDALGRVTHTNFADPATPDITVTYDVNGNVLSNRRGSGFSAVSWGYNYNELNMLTDEQLSLDGLAYDLAYQYNSAGYMTQKTLPSGREVDYTPDGLGRYNGISENGHSLASNMDYHASGALLHMNYGNGVEFNQTLNARLLPHRLTTRKVTNTSSGSALTPIAAPAAPEPIFIEVWVSKHIWLSNEWCETYAPKYSSASWLGFYCELTQVEQPAPESAPAPAPAQSSSPVTQVEFASGPVSELDLTYSYDAMGRITQQTNGVNSGHNRTYSYDILGQLKTANSPAWGNASYSYDPIGNLLSKTIGGRTVTNSYDSRNRITKSADTANGSRTITHDPRGNVTRLGSLLMSYDYSDQPVSVSGTGRTGKAANGTYLYDGNLKRVKSVVSGKTIYNVYDASGSLVHVDKYSNGNLAADITDYISGPKGTLARITNDGAKDNITYLHKDHLGSAQTGTNGAGEVLWSEHYTPFGETLINAAANDNLDGFTGHIKDSATGLNYMQARYYDPAIGRFLSIDPVDFITSGQNPAYFNRYAYAGNDPVNNVDPDGRCFGPLAIPCGIALAGGGTATAGGATVGAGTIAVGAGVTTFGVLVVTDPLDGVFTNDNADTTPEGREIRDHGKKGSGQEYIEGQGHTGESVDEIFGEGSTEIDDGGHDNASGQEKTPTTVTVGPNGKDWARTNNDTGQITQVNDRNNDRQPIPEPKQ